MGNTPVDVVFDDVDVIKDNIISTTVSRKSMGTTPVDEVIEDVDVLEGGMISTDVSRESIGSTAAEIVIKGSDAPTKSRARVSQNIASTCWT